MKERHRPFIILTLLLVAVMILWTGAAFSLGFLRKETEEFLMSYPVENGTSIRVENGNGGITVEEWGEPTLEVYALKKTFWGEKELEKTEIKVEPGTDFSVKTEHVESFSWVLVSIRIHVPENVTVDLVKTGGGDIELKGTRGDVTVRSSSGDVTVRDHEGNVSAETSNGKLRIEEIRGNVDADTSNGAITVSDVVGSVSAVSSNGDVSIKAARTVTKAESGNGNIEVGFDNITEIGCYIRTNNGEVRVHIPVDMDANITLKTSNGEIDLHHISITTSDLFRQEIEGYVGEGGPEINIRTGNGDIDLFGS